MTEQVDKHLGVLMDIQKQLGALGNETARQSAMLVALNDKVLIANGRTSKNESMIVAHQTILDNWKGRLAVIVVVSGFVGSLFTAWIKSKLGI